LNALPNSNGSAEEALALWRSGQRQLAERLCVELTAADDSNALSLLAEIYSGSGRLNQAVAALQRLAKLRATDAGVHRRLGNALLATDSFAAAVASYEASLAIEPDNVRGHNNLGQALMRLERRPEAIASFERAIVLDAQYAIAHNNLGIAHYAAGSYQRAAACYARALELDPNLVEARNNYGNTLLKLGRAAEALEQYERLPHLKPALLNRGKALHELRRFEDAVESYQGALAAEPENAEALSNCAGALIALQRPEEALVYCERAISLKPDLAEAYNNLAGALCRLCRYDEAIAACETVLRLRPDYASAMSNLANVLLACDRPEEALAYCDRALALQPEFAEAHENRAAALMAARRPDEAAIAFERLFAIDPSRRFAAGTVLGARQFACDWTNYEAAREAAIQAVLEDRPAVLPFTFLSLCDSPELQLKCARAFVADQVPADCRATWSGARHRHERLRIGYLSADYRQHATAILMAGLFEAHDRSRFETIAISFGARDSSPLSERLEHGFDRFIDVRGLNDRKVVELLGSLEIDIAVDLKGYTWGMRPGILSRRAAPLQVNYLGFPGTMGLEEIDYLIADPVVLPPWQVSHCTERIVYLPECYQVNDDKRTVPQRAPSRREAALPEKGFVFCCFNNNYKITPPVFDVWMRLLLTVPGSVLWLLQDNVVAATNLRREAQSRGVSADRLIFAPRVSPQAHLDRHILADLFLDTLPYNAHTTTADALWAGLPVLTCMGASFQGRVAASLLHAIGLPELITHSLDEYFGCAAALASSPARLQELRTRLAHNRTRRPLFDTRRFCRHLEDAYTTMWRRHEAGLSPESFTVSASPVTEA
jgi:protein O-GlcNAc transferase